MSINSHHDHISPALAKPSVSSRIILQEVLSDFQSLDDLASVTENDIHENDLKTDKTVDELESEYNKFLQITDFRRPKLQENQNCGTKFRKLNRSYSLQEIKEKGFELKTVRRGGSQQKYQDNALILSEFIM
jgi:hypothetical protein